MRCIVETCGLNFHTRESYSSHRLPKNPKLRQAWLRILDPSGTQYTIGKDARICSRHFLESDFYESGGKRKLYTGATPSIDLGPAADLPLADFPEEAHCVFLDESMMVYPVAMHESVSTGAKRVKTIRYAGDLRDDDIPSISPEEAHEILPKIYKQLQRTKVRLNCYKQQNLRLRKKVEQLKDIIIDMRDEHDGVKTKRKPQLVSVVKVEPTVLSGGVIG